MVDRSKFFWGGRNSSIELLKIFSLCIIILSHCIKTLYGDYGYVDFTEYRLDLASSTTSVQQLLMTMLAYAGMYGNGIFFIASAWFLLDSKESNKKKIIQFLLDIWIVSIIFLVVIYILRDGQLGVTQILFQLFPTTFGNNWYMTAYVLFYPLHPFLNGVLRNMSQKEHLRATLVLLFVYIVVNSVLQSSFFPSVLIWWTTFYVTIAYIKFYMTDLANNRKVNLLLAVGGIFLNGLFVVAVNYLSNHYGILSNRLLYLKQVNNPFLFLSAVGIFNLAKSYVYRWPAVNFVASCSMLIYIIHENSLLKVYYRPQWWNYIYHHFGYDHILLWALIMTVVLFVISFLCSIIYKQTFQKATRFVCDWVYSYIAKIYGRFEKKILKLN